MDAGDLDVSQQGHRFFLMQIALKCADISNPCRPWQVSKRWSQQVCDEFFKQGETGGSSQSDWCVVGGVARVMVLHVSDGNNNNDDEFIL